MHAADPGSALSEHVHIAVVDGIATITLDRPERKNPLTFRSYAILRDAFRRMAADGAVRAMVLTGAGGNFCSGGDVHDIIGPLVRMREAGDTAGLLAFTRLTGDLVRAMRACPQPIISAVDGVCAGAGAVLAMASDMRLGTMTSRVAFLFVRVGLTGADMGACALLPRLIGAGRAAELLYTGRTLAGDEAERWGFFNRLVAPDELLSAAQALAAEIASGPGFAHAMTKQALDREATMSLDDALEAEAQAQALCMQTADFTRAYNAFVARERPTFHGN